MKKILSQAFLCLLCLTAYQAFAQQSPTLGIDLTNVTTIAGNANGGHADGIGTAATFIYPYGIAVDAAENVYTNSQRGNGDSSHEAVRKITIPGLVVTTPAGGSGTSPSPAFNTTTPPIDGTGAGAIFYGPTDMVTDATGNVYVLDNGSNGQAVRKMTPAGVVTTVLNTSQYFSNGQVGLKGLAIDPTSGVLYASYSKDFTTGILDVYAYASNTGAGIVFNGGDFRNPPYFNINRFAIDAQGNFIYYSGYKIQKLALPGTITTIAGTGNNGSTGDGGPALLANFGQGTDLEVDALNNIYVLDNNRVRKVSPGGFVTAVAGYDGFPNGGHVDGIGLNARFVGGGGIVMNAARSALYVADPGNSGVYCTIRKLSAVSFHPFSTITSHASSSQYYSVSGAYLTGNATITAPAGYEVSLSENSGYASSLTFIPQNGDVFSRNIYVRLAAATAPGTYNGNVVFSSTGATSVSMPVTGVVDPHKLGGAFNFNGSGYTNIPTNNFPVGNSNYTIECWVKSPEDRFNNIIIWGNNSLNHLNGLALLTGNKIDNYWGGGLSTELIVTAPTVNDGNWHHLAATYDGTTRKLYMDGILLGSDNPTGINVSPGFTGYLGGFDYNTPFKGTLDEVKVLSKALSQNEITATMNCEIPVNTAGLSAYYKFNQGLAFENNTTITAFTDASPNGNNSTYIYGYTLDGTTSNFVTGAVTNGHSCAPCVPITSNITKVNTGCYGTATGSLSVTPTNGIAPYQYKLNSGVYGSANTFTGLKAGNYTVYIVDANGCTGTKKDTIRGFAAIKGTSSSTPATCYGTSTGSLTITPTSGASPFTYRLGTTGNYVTSSIFSNLKASAYVIYIKDANGCTGYVKDTVLQPAAITGTFTRTDVTPCYGGTNGSVTVTSTTGFAPYQYKLNTGGTYGTSNTFSGLKAATDKVYIKDAHGCEGYITVVICQPVAVAVTYTKVDPTCTNPTGSIALSAPGSPNATFRINPGSTVYTSQSSFASLAPGTYYGYAKNSSGCIGRTAAIVLSPATGCRNSFAEGKMQTANETGSNGLSVSIFPNPTKGAFTLQLNGQKTGRAEVTVTSESGVLIENRSVKTTASNQLLQFNFANKAPGIYFIKVVSEQGVQTSKVVVE